MYGVFSSWYIILALCVLAIALLIFFIVRMDKQDRLIIKEYVNKLNATNNTNADVNKKENKSVADKK